MMTATPRHIAVLSLHALYDTRVANHLSALIEAGYQVSYINWSKTQPLPQQPGLDRVQLIHRDADPRIGLNPLVYMRMLWWFYRQARRSGANRFHLHDLFLLPLAMALKWFCGNVGRGTRGVKPAAKRGWVVFDIHENYARFGGRMRRFTRCSYALFMRFVDGLVTTCPANLPAVGKPHVIVPNYQNASLFAGDDDGHEGVRVIYFGSLNSDDREVTLMFDIAEKCLTGTSTMHFEFGGPVDGFDVSQTQKRLDQLARTWPERFHWHGQMSRDRVIERTRGADIGLIFVRPDSPNLLGGSWNKIYEYLAAGCAIFATDGFDIAEQVRKVGAGRLFAAGYPQTDAQIVADELIAIVADAARLQQMQAASRALGAQCTWDSVSRRYIELYDQIEDVI